MASKRKPVKRSKKPKKQSPKQKRTKVKTNKTKQKPKTKKPTSKAKDAKRSKSEEKRRREQKSTKMAKQHKQKLLNAKRERQRQRNTQMMRIRRGAQQGRSRQAAKDKEKRQDGEASDTTGTEQEMDEDVTILTKQYQKEDSLFNRVQMHLEDLLAGLLYFLTVTIRSERTYDWLVFLANNLGLYQEYEINDYGQRLSPRTGRPVLLSLGPIRVVQIVESANQVRSYWDPYIRDFLRNSNLTTDCWRANRMALQVALCMDDNGTMYDMPLNSGEDRDPRA